MKEDFIRRLQLFEFEDQSWLPPWLRDEMTEHLSRMFMSPKVEPIHVAMTEELSALLARTNTTEIMDLCSGSGGPIPAVLPMLNRTSGPEITATLTDLYPNSRLTENEAGKWPCIRVEPTPIDARSVPIGKAGLRTMFNAVHHFQPAQVAQILQSATQGGHSIAIFEPFERTPLLALRLAAGGIVEGWRNARRYRGSKLRTIAIHLLLPTTLGWDGAVSVLRGYRAEELLAIAKGSDLEHCMTWRSQRLPFSWGAMTVLVGEPASRNAE